MTAAVFKTSRSGRRYFYRRWTFGHNTVRHRRVESLEPEEKSDLQTPETPGEELLASQVKSILLRARSRKLRNQTEKDHERRQEEKGKEAKS